MRVRWLVPLAAAALLLAGCSSADNALHGPVVPASEPGPTTVPASIGSAMPAASALPAESSIRARSTSAAPSSARSTTSPPPDYDALISANKAAATAEANRLLTVLLLPPGASPVPPTSRLGAGLGSGGALTLVDATKWLSVPTTLTATATYIKAHTPRQFGSAGNGSSTAGGPETISIGYFDDRTSTQWSAAVVAVNMTAGAGTSTVVRLDGMTQWLDPRPTPDSGPGQRISMSVAGGCPKSDAGVIGVKPKGAWSTSLLPPGTPSAGVICAYRGGSDPPGGPLWRTQKLDADAASTLSRKIAAVPIGHLDGPSPGCPESTFRVDLVALSYPGRPDADLFALVDGCPWIANGRIRSAGPIRPDQLGLPVVPWTG